MSKWLGLPGTRLVLGVVCGLGMILCSGGVARAGSLELLVTESGGPTVPITDNGGLDTDPTVGVINVNTTLLNLSLVNYQFVGLGAFSNSPGSSVLGGLLQTGTAQLIPGGTGSVSVLASDVDYSLPTPPPGIMHSSASSTFTNATVNNSNLFQSWFNGSNTLAAKETPSPIVALFSSAGNPNSQSGNAPDTPVALNTPYGLTNQKLITLTGGSVGGLATDQYTGSTVVTSVIPEPTSMALMLAALPVWLFGVMWRRKAKAA
jgi:hypothetical protein